MERCTHEEPKKEIERTAKESFDTVAELFSVLSDEKRVKLFWILCHNEECVMGLSARLGMSSPAVSHHLRLLKEGGLITSHREGKEMYYRAKDTGEAELLHRMIEETLAISCPEKEREKTGADTAGDVVKAVHEYLVSNLGERMTIKNLSHKFHINETTLKTQFKKCYGTSLSSHVKEHRMEEAGRLLRETNLSVGEVALRVGYESQSKFSEAFEETFGILPSAYKKKKDLR